MKVNKVLVSQPKPENGKSPYYDLAEKHGLDVEFRPFIKVEGLTVKEFRQSRIQIPEYTAIIFTARTAVDHFFRLCQDVRYQVPETLKYFCTSEAIALYLQKYIQYRKRKIFFGETGKFKGLESLILKHKKERYLFVVSDVHKDDTTVMDEAGIKYDKAVMYRTVSNDFEDGEKFDYDTILFFSPAGIQSLLKNFPDFEQGEINIGCFGPTTAKAVEEAGLRLDIKAPTAKCPSMVSALEEFVVSQKKKKPAAAKKA